LVVVARATALERDQPAHRFARRAGSQIVDGAAARAQIGERQVDAAALEIGPDVAQDVGQLQRYSQVQRVLRRRVARAAEDANADQAHGRRDATAVLEEIIERLVAAVDQIHFDAVDDIRERLTRQVERADERLQRASLRRARLAAVVTARQL